LDASGRSRPISLEKFVWSIQQLTPPGDARALQRGPKPRVPSLIVSMCGLLFTDAIQVRDITLRTRGRDLITGVENFKLLPSCFHALRLWLDNYQAKRVARDFRFPPPFGHSPATNGGIYSSGRRVRRIGRPLTGMDVTQNRLRCSSRGLVTLCIQSEGFVLMVIL
jgi:hypothetical protein